MHIINTLKIFTAINGHGHWVQLNLQFLFNFFQQVKTVLTIPVHFIDKNNHRCFTHGNTSISRLVCASTPFTLSITNTTLSTAVNVLKVSSAKSLWPGVSSKLIRDPRIQKSLHW